MNASGVASLSDELSSSEDVNVAVGAGTVRRGGETGAGTAAVCEGGDFGSAGGGGRGCGEAGSSSWNGGWCGCAMAVPDWNGSGGWDRMDDDDPFESSVGGNAGFTKPVKSRPSPDVDVGGLV